MSRTTHHAQRTTAIDACSRCASVISLRAPTVKLPARPWICGGCGSVYFAAAAEQQAGRRSGRARLVAYDRVIDVASVHLAASKFDVPRPALHRLVQFLSASLPDAAEKRRATRYPMALPVVSIPMGANFRVNGEALQMTTLNVSRRGAALLDGEPCNASYLVLDFSPAGLSTAKAVFEVLRVTPVLSAFEIAGRLISRVEADG